jgi:autotransporter strand-loop-strand O-heptosyltransferase
MEQEKIKIYAHGSYIGTTGYNNHTRDFFRQLSKHTKMRVRNFTIGKSWSGMSENPHDGEPYFNEIDKNILYQQTLWTQKPHRTDVKMYQSEDKEFKHDLNLVLSETNHHYYYDGYIGPKIAYNVWESTLQPEEFFNKLKEYDELWVPSKWQKDCMVKQGYDTERIKIVPEGVDDNIFYPEETEKLPIYNDGRFKFLLFGRWDYRKSIKEVIESFLKTFDKSEPVDLVVSIDNPFGENIDGFKTTKERLEFYGLNDERIKIITFPSREDYIKFMKTGHVFVSCARSEGWNLPLIEAMACGTPSIYSNCSGQLEFAEGKGHPVKILSEKLANQNSYARYTMSDLVGNYYEPDFDHLCEVMRDVYTNYKTYKQKALSESIEIREKFNWDNIGNIGYETVLDFYKRYGSPNYVKPKIENKINISFLDGPKVEILGDEKKEYKVEFFDNDKLIHSGTIKNNMWINCGRKYFTNWVIKINGEVQHKFDLEGKRVLISFESKSVGDTIAWAPYAVDFAKKHNCKVILSTFNNDWFRGLDAYKDIDFINPGESVGCYVVYRIGWFKDEKNGWKKFDCYPNQVNLIPLQKTATDILGLDFEEKNYGLNLKIGKRPIKEKYIVFGPEATAGCKEWSYENWVLLSKLIKQLGYEVVVLTRKPYHMYGVRNISGRPLDDVATYLNYADKFIGLGSGLSWINWALGKYTYMINGFVQEGHEFTSNLTKITNDLCIKCWNDPVHVFDAGDWDWCPVYKGTELQHICQKSITSLQVFNILEL